MTDDFEMTCLIEALAVKSNEAPEKRFTIPVVNRDGKHIGTLVCVDRSLATEINTITNLTDWRQKYMRYFLTQFNATNLRTKSWLENNVISSPDRMLFIICLKTGQAIGNFGISKMTATSGELDNLIRGIKGGDPRLIYYCEIALLSWMFGRLGYRTSSLHVFSNNLSTIKLHLSVGFTVLSSIRLTQRKSPHLTEYLLNSNEGEPANFNYLKMVLNRDKFLDQHPYVHSLYAEYWQ